MQKYAINRKWFYLYGTVKPRRAGLQYYNNPLGIWLSVLAAAFAGAIIFFAYLYIRPLIRRGLGSASE